MVNYQINMPINKAQGCNKGGKESGMSVGGININSYYNNSYKAIGSKQNNTGRQNTENVYSRRTDRNISQQLTFLIWTSHNQTNMEDVELTKHLPAHSDGICI